MSSSLEKFPCTGCGLCCKNVANVLKRVDEGKVDEPYLEKVIREFPYKAMEDGSCEMLDEEGRCQVYDDRPDLCNTDTMFKNLWSKSMSKDEYFMLSASACNAMMRFHNVPKEFHIDEKQFN